MREGLYLIDFHAHLKGPGTLHNFCPEDQHTSFFRSTTPFFEGLANFSEPLHDAFTRYLALNFRDGLSRLLYASVGQFGLMEAIRLFKNYDVDQLLRSMDRHGLDHAVVCSLEPFITTHEILEAIAPHRRRLSIFASVGRNEADPTGYLAQHIESGEISGLKIHPVVGGYACGELYHRTKDIVDLATQHGLPVLIHTGHIPVEAIRGLAAGCTEVNAIEPLIAAFPQARFVLAHIGWESWRRILHLAEKYPNIMVETSWQPARIIRRAVDKLGAQRVLFGSDFPLFKQSTALSELRQALSPREFVSVASTNARRLLDVRLFERTAS